MANVLIIGGNRHFGRRLISLHLDAGDTVTVLNRGSAPAPENVTHLIADRNDEVALDAVLGERRFDVVVDQVCYTPAQADIARRVFAGRTGRYVMTSSIEVYDPADTHLGPFDPRTPVAEDAVDPRAWPVDLSLPWLDEEFRKSHYSEGKRQAEAVFGKADFPFVSVRCAHVLGGGAADHTGRFAEYVERVTSAGPVPIHRQNFWSSFIRDTEIAAFLFWTARADFTGPVNACGTERVDVFDLTASIAAHVGVEPRFRLAAEGEVPAYFSGPFYGMDNSRAAELGFAFGRVSDWLPIVVAETVDANAARG